MTIEISQQQRDQAHTPPVPTHGRAVRNPLVVGIIAVGIIAGLGALTLAGLDIGHPDEHLAVYAAACFVLAGLAGSLICLNCLLADRQEFYRRGHLAGWMQGWRGQEPDVDDPLLK